MGMRLSSYTYCFYIISIITPCGGLVQETGLGWLRNVLEGSASRQSRKLDQAICLQSPVRPGFLGQDASNSPDSKLG